MIAPAGKLLAATITLLAALAVASWLILTNAARGYSDELTQQLNRSIAMYVVAEAPLIRRGRVNESQLTVLAQRAMVINPMAEVYLLDPSGRIIGHSITVPLAAPVVDLRPIRVFLAGGRRSPIYGTDPRDPRAARVFSAAEIRHESRLEGYVYVVLGGAASQGSATTIASSYILRAALVTSLVVLSLAAVAAWALTTWLTRPLRELHGRVVQLGEEHGGVGSRAGDGRAIDLDAVRAAVESLATRLAAQVESLKQADRLRRDLYASISHDLRTPLTAMRGYLDTLSRDDRPLPVERQRAFIAIAVRHCERLSRLVDQVSSLARLDATTVRLRPEPVALTELAQDVVTKFQGLAESARVHLHLEIDPQAPPVMADIGMLETVLQNLLDNALRHTPSGGEIVVCVHSRENAVETGVRDSGTGIAPSELERLQQPFEVGVGGRTGLGLAIVKRVLGLHGTELRLSSMPGHGTTATFALAAQPASAAHDRDSPSLPTGDAVMLDR
jgi:two-component system, OmpR family, sensor kinase